MNCRSSGTCDQSLPSLNYMPGNVCRYLCPCMQELPAPTALKLGQQQPRPLDIYGPGHPGAAKAWYGCGHVNSDLLGLTSHDKGEECIGGLRLQPLLDPVHACHHSLIRHVSWPSRWLAEHASQSRAAQPHVSMGRICRSCALLVRSDRADVAVGEGYIAYGAARARFCSCGPCWWALWCARGAPLPFRCGAGVTVSACVPTSWPSHAFGEPTGPAPPLSHMYRCSATCTLAADEPVTRSTGHTGTSTL